MAPWLRPGREPGWDHRPALLDAAGGPAAAAAGLNDRFDTVGPQTRVGLVHAALNTTAVSPHLASLVAGIGIAGAWSPHAPGGPLRPPSELDPPGNSRQLNKPAHQYREPSPASWRQFGVPLRPPTSHVPA